MPLPPERIAELAARLNVTEATALRSIRRTIVLPDGRTIGGHAPGVAAVTIPEHDLRDRLGRQLNGITEAVLPFGRADVLTAKAVFEVEPQKSWRHGAQQVLAYSAQCGLPPALALFGQMRHDQVLKLYLRLRDGRPRIALWWWSGYSWQPIRSRRECHNMPAWPREKD